MIRLKNSPVCCRPAKTRDCDCEFSVLQKDVPITYDPKKSELTFALRGLTFDMVERFDWAGALIGLGHQRSVTETRFVAIGEIDDRIYAVVFTFEGDGVRIISLRRARHKESHAWRAARTRSSSTRTIPS